MKTNAEWCPRSFHKKLYHSLKELHTDLARELLQENANVTFQSAPRR
jgi:hypothetical protein